MILQSSIFSRKNVAQQKQKFALSFAKILQMETQDIPPPPPMILALQLRYGSVIHVPCPTFPGHLIKNIIFQANSLKTLFSRPTH